MNRAIIRSLSVSLALLGAIPLADADDLNLLGCWRSQNVDQYGSDGKIIHLNSDCVSEFSSKQIRSECQNASGRVQNLSVYEITAPGRYVATPSDGSTAAKEPPQPRVVEYVVDAEWLTLTFFSSKARQCPAPRPLIRSWPSPSGSIRCPAKICVNPEGPRQFALAPDPLAPRC